MITNYEIRKIKDEDILLLYFDFDNEFNYQNLKKQYKDMKSYIKKFIKDNKISFAGSTAIIIVGGSILGNVLLNKDNNIDKYETYALKDRYQEIIDGIPSDYNPPTPLQEEPSNTVEDDAVIDENAIIENDESNDSVLIQNISNVTQNVEVKEKESNNSVNNNVNIVSNNVKEENYHDEEPIVDNNTYITIQRSSGQMVSLELEEYITGVVSSEMPALFHTEALKAQAIIARTYALKAISKGKILNDSNSTQNYKDINQLKTLWGNNFNSYYNKIKEAVSNTKGMYLTYNGNYIEAVYHSTSNGKTENSIYGWGNYYPYLVSVDSKYDNLNPSFEVKSFLSYDNLSTLLNMEVNVDTEFNIIDKTDGDRVKTIIVGDKTYTGVNFRNTLKLRSADFDIEKTDDGIIFITRGYGHGVGMSQYGANGMAKNGYSYVQILSHYYPGTVISS